MKLQPWGMLIQATTMVQEQEFSLVLGLAEEVNKILDHSQSKHKFDKHLSYSPECVQCLINDKKTPGIIAAAKNT